MTKNLVYCQHCHKNTVQSRGYEKTKTQIKRRYVCTSCGKGTYLKIHELGDEEYDEIMSRPYVWDDGIADEMVSSYKGFVVSCIQNDTETNHEFMNALKAYCKYNNYRLLLIPTRYQNPNCMERPTQPYFDRRYEQYFIENELHLNNNLKIVGNVNVTATAVNPISGMNHITQGKTTVIGHPQLQMNSLPVNSGEHPILLTTTGTVSNENKYRTDEKNIPKAGYKAMYFRTHAALVLEIEDSETFHIRQLCADKTGGFYDHMGYFAGDGIVRPGLTLGDVDALITGDEHWFHMDNDVLNATYGPQNNSIINTFKPRYILRHDVLDSQSISHHHKNNKLRRYEKHHTGKDSLESELHLTFKGIFDTTPEYATSVIVPSNHNDHLERWLNECDPAREPWNAKLYHELMYKCLDYIENNPDKDPDPMELWACARYNCNNTVFLKRDDSFQLHGIILNLHGDKGPNGARATNTNLSRAGHKVIKGHCLTEDFDVLTPNGWEKISNSDPNHVMGYEDGKNIWAQVKEKQKYLYTGKLLTVKSNGRFSQTVTPNHHLSLKNGDYLPVCEAILTRNSGEIPISAVNGLENGILNIDENTLRKVVAVCADGSFDNRTMKFHLKKERKIERVKELFGEDISFGSYTKKGSLKITIPMNSQSYSDICRWVSPYTNQKCLPEQFISLSKHCREIFIDELSYWDGTYQKDNDKQSYQVSTFKENEANLIASLLSFSGYRVTFDKPHTRNKNEPKDKFRITWSKVNQKFQNKKSDKHFGRAIDSWGVSTFDVVETPVYCFSTTTNNFWVRCRKTGLVSLTGNSHSIGIDKGVFSVGISAKTDLEYTKGSMSSWTQTHCILYSNGQRQLINIVGDNWRA